MAFNKIISKLFGNKAQRDLSEINPVVKRIQEAYPAIEQLSNDELRAKTKELEQQISDYVAEEKAQIESLKAGMEEIELDEREGMWNQVDKLEKEITEKQEKILNELLPVAFSIMKDTARRFTQNSEVVVTATQFDRDLATNHDFVRIEGEKAIYQNHWMAGGNEITWDMIHYDVQLFGGVVLHQGKIAEMATG
ncbi:MAG: preprotein translocase subunit SecA, partial [Bacteroidales bacterium]|nr:preprotein translocase subunit SecA [Bacteroidales bacterium]